MKAKYIIALSMACAASALTSCGDFLDTKPAAIYSEDLVWSSPANVEAFILGRYGSVNQYYTNHRYWAYAYTPNMVKCRGAAPGECRGLMENTYHSGGVNDISNRFGTIRSINMIIEKCGASTALDDISRKQYVAVGKLMRAMIYYDFARKTGRYIWVDKVLTTESDFDIPLTKDIVESYQHVLTDLREAIPDLPETAAPGEYTADFARAFTSEVLLTAAAYTNDAAALQQNGKSLYQEAIDLVDAISHYDLDPDYEGMFNENGAYSSPEIMMATYYSKDNATCQSTDQVNLIANVMNGKVETNGCGPLWKVDGIFECWLEGTPSQNLVDDYLVIDQADGKAKRWNETSQFVNNTREIDQTTAFSLIDHKSDDQVAKAYQVTGDANISELMYNNRDARFDATVLHDGSEFYGETLAMYSYGNMTRWTTANYGNDHVPLTNYSNRKSIYTNMSPRPFYNTATAYHSVIYRYGRALLNKAEAQLRLNKVADAVETFNRTRTVHGKLPASTASTLAEAWTDYKRERHVELYYESDYYFSLLRWGKYGNEANSGLAPGSTIPELNAPATFIEIKPDRSAAFVGNVQFYNDERVFNVKSYLWPIPVAVINANDALSLKDQNPGWE